MKEGSLVLGRMSVLFAAIAALAVAFALSMPAPALAADYAAASTDTIGAADLQAQTLSAAATTKVVKHTDFTTKLTTAKKKATVVKKGTTKLKVKAQGGFIMFKAPKTKTYTMKISGLKSPSSKTTVYGGFAEVLAPSGKSITFKTVKTQGGKASTLWLAAKGYADDVKKVAADTRLTSRYAKLKIKKGGLVFLYLYGTSAFNATLKIS